MLKVNLIPIILLVFSIVKVELVAIERNENVKLNENQSQHLLSRRRRYLTFPEGSSLQLGKFIRKKALEKMHKEYQMQGKD